MTKYKFIKSASVLIDQVNLKEMNGFSFKPKNNIEYDGIKVERATIINPVFVESILKRKNNNQLEKYLEYIMLILEDEDAGEDDVVIALDELNRFRMMIINKHRKYLKDEYIDKMLKRIKVLEDELRLKRISYNVQIDDLKKSR